MTEHALIQLAIIIGFFIITLVLTIIIFFVAKYTRQQQDLGFYPTNGDDIPSEYIRKGKRLLNHKKFTIHQIENYRWIPIFGKNSFQKLQD